MKIDSTRRTAGLRLLLLNLLAVSSPTHAQTRTQCEQQFKARSGQPGKDVMWIATIDPLVTAMLRAAKVTNADRVIDLGSGDGKIPIAAAKHFGARARGIGYEQGLVQLAECYARAEHVTHKVCFEQADIFATDFSDATVLTLYLSPTINLKLRPTILNMLPGTRVVSNTFDMGDWQPDRDGANRSSFKVTLEQRFQVVRSTPATNGKWVKKGRVNGSVIELTLVDGSSRELPLKGRIEKDRIEAEGFGEAAEVVTDCYAAQATE